MLTFSSAKDGRRTVSWNGIHLHSPYSPLEGVNRFLDRVLPPSPRTIVLLGETLGYLAEEIVRRCPGVKLLILYYHPAFLTAAEPMGIPFWHPHQNRSLLQFLHQHLSDLDVLGFSLLSWPNSDRIFPKIFRYCSGEVHRFIRERTGSLTTIGGFGRRWIKNTLQNFLNLPRIIPLRLPQATPPLIIAASGPTLESSLDLLKKYRPRFGLWALPSALEALLSKNLLPDLIIQTDPGYYASLHLRKLEAVSIPLAMPLTSVRGLWRSLGPVHIFSQGSIAEKAIAEASGVRLPTIAATGTVAAAALLLAKQALPPWVLFAGLDFCSRDVLAHTRPHSFEILFSRNENRLGPCLGTLYRCTLAEGKPVSGGSQSLSLQTYADWMDRAVGASPLRIYRLNPSPIDIRSMQSLSLHAAEKLLSGLPKKGPSRVRIIPYEIPEDRFSIISRVLADWGKLLAHRNPTAQVPGTQFFSCPQVEELVSSLSMAGLFKFLKGNYSTGTKEFTIHFNHLLKETRESLIAIGRELYLK